MMGKLYALVEGRGEVAAAQNLLVRLSHRIGLFTPWAPPLRWTNLHQWEAPRRGGILKGAEFIRSKPDVSGLLILRDEDDDCPAQRAPMIAAQLRALGLPFPTAYVLLKPEYEVLFLPCLHLMSEHGFPEGLEWDRDDWEARRGVKEWLSKQLPGDEHYKPTILQLDLTRCLDFDLLERANVPCFGSLTRALELLRDAQGMQGLVYPGGVLGVAD